jgi:hypothetical protein
MTCKWRFQAAVLVGAVVMTLGSQSAVRTAAEPQAAQQKPPAGTKPEPKTLPPSVDLPPLPEAQNEKPAVSVPPPIFPTAPPEDKQFVMERVFNYRRLLYKPAIVVQRVTRDQASEVTPEQAFAAQMSAMQAGDYEWWLSTWDKASQKFHADHGAQIKRTPADWRAIWDKALRGQQIRLVERVQTGIYGPYVMLVFEMSDAAGKQTFRSSYVAKEEAGRWVATLELSQDPLFQFYEPGKDKVTITVR